MLLRTEMNRSNDRYGPVAQMLHWVTAVLVLVAFLYGPGGRESRVYADAMNFDRQLHETFGVTVFLLVILRVLWRIFDARPDPPKVPRWMDLASKAVQGLLYVLLFALPLTAIAGAWLEGHPLTLLGDLRVGPYIPVAHDLGAQIASVHGWLGDTLMWLAGLHAAAAIFHHFALRDEVLVSMLPRWLQLRRPIR